MMSCEDNLGRVWVDFPTAADAERFLDIAAGDYDEEVESLYNRVTGEYEPDDDWEQYREHRVWQYRCSPMDYGAPLYDEEGNLEVPGSERCIVLSVSVRFPHDDHAEVLRRVQAAGK
jgi:hypothetical protein